MNRITSRLGLTAIALVSGSALFAQSTTTGSVSGRVTSAGKNISGATLRLSSGQVTRTIVTNADGSFRIGLLNPGSWAFQISASGFNPSQGTVMVSVNDNTTLNFKLIDAGSATVAVTGMIGAMDFTTSQVGLTQSMDDLKNVPTGRDFNDLITLSPGVVSSGALGGPSISGASSLENSYYIDGLSTLDLRKGYQGGSLPTDFIDQVEIQTGGFKAEYSALGGVFSAITKSGTNTFSGSAWLNVDSYRNQAKAKRNSVARQAEPTERNDYGFSAGGALIPDQLFYFVGANLTTGNRPGSVNLNNLRDSDTKNEDQNFYAKVNYYLTENQQITAFTQQRESTASTPDRRPLWGTAQLGGSSEATTNNYGLSYDWNPLSNFQLSFKFGHSEFEEGTTPTDATNTSTSDYVRGYLTGAAYHDVSWTTGGQGVWQSRNAYTSDQYRLDLSYFLDNHSIKLGLSRQESSYAIAYGHGGTPTQFYQRQSASIAGYNSPWHGSSRSFYVSPKQFAPTFTIYGDEDYTYYIEATWYDQDATVKSLAQSFYLQDTVDMGSGINVSFGARVDQQTITNPQGQDTYKFDNIGDLWQPRLGFVWDINQDGSTKISANLARYYLAVPMQPVMRTGGTEIYTSHWYTAVGSPYQVNVLAGRASGNNGTAANQVAFNRATGALTINPSQYLTPARVLDYSYGFTLPEKIDGFQLTRRDELVVGVDQVMDSNSFLAGWTLGGKFIYRQLRNPMEDWTPDGNHTYVGNPKPGRITVGGVAVENFYEAEAYNDYTAYIFQAEKRTSTSYLNFSYTWSKLYGTFEGVGQTSNGQADATITSSWDFPKFWGEGLLPTDRNHVIRLFGSKTYDLFGNPFTIGLRATAQSGTPISYLDDGTATGYDTHDVDPYGYGTAIPKNHQYGSEGRTPKTAIADLSLGYTITTPFKLSGKRVTVTPEIDIFNITNTRRATSVDIYGTLAQDVPNSNYGTELSWLQGRSFRFGVKVNF